MAFTYFNISLVLEKVVVRTIFVYYRNVRMTQNHTVPTALALPDQRNIT